MPAKVFFSITGKDKSDPQIIPHKMHPFFLNNINKLPARY